VAVHRRRQRRFSEAYGDKVPDEAFDLQLQGIRGTCSSCTDSARYGEIFISYHVAEEEYVFVGSELCEQPIAHRYLIPRNGRQTGVILEPIQLSLAAT
jgi:hypothetical protein